MYGAVAEHGRCATENEIRGALDVALIEKHAMSFTSDVERVLIAEQPHVPENRSIGVDCQRNNFV